MTSQQQNAPRSPARVKRSRVNPMASVALITAAALVGVGVLAVQANGSAPNKAPAQAAAKQQPAASTNQAGQAAPSADPQLGLPANSGKGKRVVYSLSKARIWLVGADDKVQLTAQAVPGTIVPEADTYKVSKWQTSGKASDGAAVQYEVLWGTRREPTKFGFDTIASLPPDQMPGKPASGTKTGGVRLTQNDAQAVWQFATVKDMPVVVVA